MTLSDRFSKIFAGFPEARVLCLGDVMLDHFIYGDVSRISPEAPVPVFQIRKENLMLGGAGNVARNLSALTSSSTFVAFVGDDPAGHAVASLLGAEEGVNPLLQILPDRRTTEKSRFVAGVQQLLRADHEQTDPLDRDAEDQVLQAARNGLEDSDVLAISDYGKGLLTGRVLTELLADAHRHNMPSIIDPKGRDYSKYRGAFVTTPNRSELAEASGMPVTNDEEIVAAARHVMETCGIRNILVTRSQDGMTLVCEDGSVHHIPARAREVFDVSGAGDTVVATLAAALAAGGSLLDGARLANLAGGIVVGKIGTATATLAEMRSAVAGLAAGQGNGKIMDAELARATVSDWHAQGLTVGFTNGCFDLVHQGHVSLLRQARACCDRLIVGLNSDSSVRRLKGDTRPIQDEEGRAAVLAAMQDVDMVIAFAEDTPRELIAALVPDVLVKGADYAGKTVVGSDIVEAAGGRVILAELTPGRSTSNIVSALSK